jgi:superfamily I DNA/RNA helicase
MFLSQYQLNRNLTLTNHNTKSFVLWLCATQKIICQKTKVSNISIDVSIKYQQIMIQSIHQPQAYPVRIRIVGLTLLSILYHGRYFGEAFSSLPNSKRKLHQRLPSVQFSTSHVETASEYYIGQDKDSIDNKDFTWDTEKRRQLRLKRLQSVNLSKMKIDRKSINNGNFLDSETGHDTSEVDEKYNDILGKTFLYDRDQMNSILSDAPAILLESAAGTGKTVVLAGRIAHLIQTKKVEPQHMIVLSFTNRASIALRNKAMDILYSDSSYKEDRQSMERRLWCGTIHSFAMNILKKYNTHNASIRVVSAKEMKNMVRRCLGRLNCSRPERLVSYRKALDGCNQNVETLVHYIIRCLELWKEGGILMTSYNFSFKPEAGQSQNNPIHPDDYIELAMRIGIPLSAATLALDISNDYQLMHATAGTADPSDAALMAYEFLIANPGALSELRSKLKQIVLDEYQDVSVAQHRLIRLVVLGITEEETNNSNAKNGVMASILSPVKKNKYSHDGGICYNVPRIICAGDGNQSIYGWRGAAPSLTVDGFRSDFPQGLVLPLGTCYRLPKHILNAADVLIGNKDVESNDPESVPTCFNVSPSAAKSAATLLSSQILADESDTGQHNSFYATGQKLLLEGGIISESKSAVFIKGLWDAREEAKYIASEIRKKYKERMTACNTVMIDLDNKDRQTRFFDSSDVAVMGRSKGQLQLIQVALRKYGIPSVTPKGEEVLQPSSHAGSDSRLLPMKPVQLITMHQAKGDEFDDVYLAGWTEGVFPHPASLKSNRLHEERRIAYVALTRARQRVVLTYSYVKQDSYFGPNGKRKDVTKQVEPSRFLYDLFSVNEIAGKGASDHNQVEWNNDIGFKEIIAGKNLPESFADSYRIPAGYQTGKVRRITDDSIAYRKPVPASKKEEDVDQYTSVKKEKQVPFSHATSVNFDIPKTSNTLLESVTSCLYEVFQKKRGCQGKYKAHFRSILYDHNCKRGSAIVLTQDGREKIGQAVDALVHAPSDYLTTRPLSQCTAEQLGLYLVYLLLKTQ